MLKEKDYKGKTYFYYEDDIFLAESGNYVCTAQDEDGNIYNMIWKECGTTYTLIDVERE